MSISSEVLRENNLIYALYFLGKTCYTQKKNATGLLQVVHFPGLLQVVDTTCSNVSTTNFHNQLATSLLTTRNRLAVFRKVLNFFT